jgi:hypothetical protein
MRLVLVFKMMLESEYDVYEQYEVRHGNENRRLEEIDYNE